MPWSELMTMKTHAALHQLFCRRSVRRDRPGHTAGTHGFFNDRVHRVLNDGMGGLADYAERLGQVARPHEDDVHPIDQEDVVQVFKGFARLAIPHEKQVFIDAAEILVEIHHAVARRALGVGEAAVPLGRVIDRPHRFAEIVGRAQVRHMDAIGAGVQRLQDLRGVVVAHAHDGGHPMDLGHADQVDQRLLAHGGVFVVEYDKVQAGLADQFRDRRIDGLDERPDHRLALSELCLEAVGFSEHGFLL